MSLLAGGGHGHRQSRSGTQSQGSAVQAVPDERRQVLADVRRCMRGLKDGGHLLHGALAVDDLPYGHRIGVEAEEGHVAAGQHAAEGLLAHHGALGGNRDGSEDRGIVHGRLPDVQHPVPAAGGKRRLPRRSANFAVMRPPASIFFRGTVPPMSL